MDPLDKLAPSLRSRDTGGTTKSRHPAFDVDHFFRVVTLQDEVTEKRVCTICG